MRYGGFHLYEKVLVIRPCGIMATRYGSRIEVQYGSSCQSRRKGKNRI